MTTNISRRAFMAAAAAGAAALQGTRAADAAAGVWPKEKAWQWYRALPWLVGCNFMPSTAINQLEMWQAETFDPATIDRELGWAEALGFNTVRVFLHDVAWTTDREGFAGRIDRFLGIAARHGIRPMLVIFDSCWNPLPNAGPQPAPRPHVHNSGWLQSPGTEALKDPARRAALKPYVQDILRRFGRDDRVLCWDLFNEVNNRNGGRFPEQDVPEKPRWAIDLMKRTFEWAREVAPSQPLTVCVWDGDWSSDDKLAPWQRFVLENSDVVSFHRYGDLETTRRNVGELKRFGRPILCTEYMARPSNSTFETILPLFKQEGVAAYNWGFVAGKTQTQYPWDSWQKKYDAEPPVWFHDIFRPDGTPYRPAEADFIRTITGKAKP